MSETLLIVPDRRAIASPSTLVDWPIMSIIIVTGIRDLDPRLTLRPSVVGYLTKPFRPAKVRDMVTKAVGLVNALPPGERIRGTLQPVSDEDIASVGDADEDPDDNAN